MSFSASELNGKNAYRPDIDGLRAIAVTAVVLYHAGLYGFSGGFVGVDIFFVISGYLITGIIWKELSRGEFSLQDFYVRRIKRIFPALFAVLFVCSLAASYLLIPADLAAFGKSAKASVLFYSNIHWIKVANYFAGPAIENPLLHIWSLGVEEQFYAAWPLILLLLARTIPAQRILYAVLALAVVCFILAELRLPEHPKDAFYLPWCRGWELLLGAMLALSPVAVLSRRAAAGLGAAGLIAIAIAMTFYDSTTRFPGFTALLPCAGAALVIAGGSAANPVSRLLSAGPVRHIGLISYSLYLIHWPLFSFAALYLGEEPAFGYRLLLAAISFPLAHLSWRYIETPFRAGTFPKARVFGGAAAAASLLIAMAVSFHMSGGLPFRAGNDVLQAEVMDREYAKYCRTRTELGFEGGNLCEFGADRGGAYDFVVWGDSHAEHFLPALATLANERGLSGAMLSKLGCQPFLDHPGDAKQCGGFNSAVARWIEGHPVKLAILASRWLNGTKYFRRYLKQPAANPGGLANTLAFLNGKGISVTIMEQVPEFPQDVSFCRARSIFYQRELKGCATVPAAVYESRQRFLHDYFGRLREQYIFTLAGAPEVFCDGKECRSSAGDTVLMVDNNHLTVAGSLYLGRFLKIPLLTDPATGHSF